MIDFTKTYLGIEFGSTRIKGVLIDDAFNPVAYGAYDWENRFENGYWTYSADDFIAGMQGCFASLAADVLEKFGKPLDTVAAIGISGMMHGYLAFDKADNLLVPFRTWRNTTTAEAADELSALMNFTIPQRWSVSHLYQAILSGEEHVPEQSGEQQYQQAHRHGVQHNEKRLCLENDQHGTERVGLAP